MTEIEKEFADFVDKHDTSEMIDKRELVEAKDVKISIPARKTAITMNIYPALLERVKRIAEAQQIPYSIIDKPVVGGKDLL